uniref:Uncharacterized protein n=1 Tax=Arundo donax TaxID=35708 RepID=A0A0A8YZ62_ARUDO
MKPFLQDWKLGVFLSKLFLCFRMFQEGIGALWSHCFYLQVVGFDDSMD